VNTKIKKIIGVLLVSMQLFVLVPAGMAESRPMEARKLLVTAYYSPLPNQSFYIKGTYEADIRLNGRGTNGADGTEVYIGMLAAPKTYPFGTRVKIPGLGVGEVHDRGGAILARKGYDRIDVWMGNGEEGLARALNWGARLVEGEVYFTAHQIEPGINYGWVSSKLPTYVENKLIDKTLAYSQPAVAPVATPAPTTVVENKVEFKEVAEVKENKKVTRLEQNLNLLTAGLGENSNGEAVVNLQRMLWELGYYDGQLSGDYDSATIDAVYAFQVDSGILQSSFDLGAGYFGKKTLATMTNAIIKKIGVLSDYPKEVLTWAPAKRILPQIAALEAPTYAVERQELHFSEVIMNTKVVQDSSLKVELDLHDRNENVVTLQNILIEGGYLQADLNTGYFGQKTEEAVLKFQIEKGIVTSSLDPGAGRVGPQTLSSLNSI